jgi:hypothetical protein
MSFPCANASIDRLIALGPRMGSSRGLEQLEHELLRLNAILASQELATRNDLLRLKGVIDSLSRSLATLQQLVTSRIAAQRPETESVDQC